MVIKNHSDCLNFLNDFLKFLINWLRLYFYMKLKDKI